jgi:hypothetical protein
VNLWLDEDTQVGCSILNFPTAAGAYQSQPPLDMVFAALGVHFSDYSVWGQRLHAALFSTLSGVLIYFFTKIMAKSRLLALTLAGLFSFQFYVIEYGYEARPISLSLFCELLLLINLFIALHDADSEEKTNRNWSIGALGFIYLCSLGLQPVFVVAGIICYLGIYSYFKKKFRATLGAVCMAFLCFLPIQNFIKDYSSLYLVDLKGLGIVEFFSEIKADNYYILNEFFKPYGYLALALFVVLLFVSCFKQKSSRQSGGVFRSRFFLFFVLGFFCSVLIPFYKSRVNYGVVPRYVIACLPLIFMLLAYELKSLIYAKHRKIASGTLALLLLGGGAGFYNFGPLWSLESAYEKDDLRAVYTEIKKISPDTEKNLVLALALRMDAWYPVTLLNNTFYYRKDPRGQYFYWHPSIEDYEEELKKPSSKIENVFFIYYEAWSEKKLEAPGHVADFRGMQLFRIEVKPGEKLAQKVVDFIEPVFKKTRVEDKLYIAPLEYLIASYHYLHQDKIRNRYIQLYFERRTDQNSSVFLNERIKDPFKTETGAETKEEGK